MGDPYHYVLPPTSSAREVSSAVERLFYTQDVAGSIPAPPTTRFRSLMRNFASWFEVIRKMIRTGSDAKTSPGLC